MALLIPRASDDYLCGEVHELDIGGTEVTHKLRVVCSILLHKAPSLRVACQCLVRAKPDAVALQNAAIVAVVEFNSTDTTDAAHLHTTTK